MQGLCHARFAGHAGRRPESPAIGDIEGRWTTYSEAFKQICYVRSALDRIGIGPEDRVASVIADGPDCATLFFGVTAGSIYAPLNASAPEPELRKLAEGLRPTLLVHEGAHTGLARHLNIAELRLRHEPRSSPGIFEIEGHERRGPLAEPRWPLDGERISHILHTSGTTASPRRVLIPHRMLAAGAAALDRVYEMDERDRHFSVTPMFHSLGVMRAMVAPLCSGSGTVIAPAFDAAAFFDQWERLRPTCFSCVPAVYKAIAERAAGRAVRLTPPRWISSVASPLPPAVRDQIEHVFGVPVLQTYGMTEALVVSADPVRLGAPCVDSAGVVAAGEVAVVEGEVLVRGPHVTPGYDGDAAANAAAFRDGWFRTGDQGRIDGQNRLYLTGRIKELINRGGDKIAPLEVDAVLLEHPEVRDTASFAFPCEKVGEEVGAAVVLLAGAAVSAGELQEFAAGRLAPFKVPRRIVFVDEVPRTATGKPDRQACAALVSTAPRGSTSVTGPRTGGTIERLTALWGDVLGVASPAADRSFFELGGSLEAMRLLARIGAEFGVEEPKPALLWRAQTIRAMAELLERGVNAGGDMVEIDARGGGARVIWLAPDLLYRDVWTRLAGWRPLFGLHVSSRLFAAADATMESVAAHCRQVLLQGPVDGPCVLAGWCAMGVLAFELARQLVEQGMPAPQVLVFDGHDALPIRSEGLERQVIRASRLFDKVWFHASRPGSVLRTRLKGGVSGGERDELRVLHQYRAGAYEGAVLHVMAADRPRGRYRTPERVWGPVVKGPHRWVEVPGDHRSMFREPNAEALAGAVMDLLPVARSAKA